MVGAHNIHTEVFGFRMNHNAWIAPRFRSHLSSEISSVCFINEFTLKRAIRAGFAKKTKSGQLAHAGCPVIAITI
jgi:hypothetical protein